MQRREFLASLPVILPLAGGSPNDFHDVSQSDSAPERPIEHRLIMALWNVADLCQEFFEETCAGCECPSRPGWCAECEDVDGLAYQVRMFLSMFESAVVTFPEMQERHRALSAYRKLVRP